VAFWQSIKDTLAPFSSIASELRVLRELYELDLVNRPTPIVRITEKPSRNDTEVSYMDEPQKKKSAKDKLLEDWENDEETIP